MVDKEKSPENGSMSEVINFLQSKAVTIRKDILAMIYAAQSGHPGGSLSSADIMTALYFHVKEIVALSVGYNVG